jgi:hypothetical protein
MFNPEEDTAEIYDLERKLEILQQENAAMELDIAMLQTLVATRRKEAEETKAQVESVADLKKAIAVMLPNLETASDKLSKMECEVKSHPNLADDMEELTADFGKLMKLRRQAEIDKCLDPMNEFLDVIVGESGRWKLLEKQSQEERVKQDELRDRIEVAKKKRREVVTCYLYAFIFQILMIISNSFPSSSRNGRAWWPRSCSTCTARKKPAPNSRKPFL